MNRRSYTGICAVVFAVTASCSGSKGVGEYCSDSSECTAPATCILKGSFTIANGQPTCDATAKVCSVTCSVDADCAGLGPGHICVTDCFAGSCFTGSH